MRNASQARAFCRAEAKRTRGRYHNDCLRFCRNAWGVARKYGSASIAWSHTRYRHFTKHAPLGALWYWTGGSEGFGHIAVSAGDINGVAYCWSTDFGKDRYFGDGRVRLIPVSSISHEDDPSHPLVCRGWAEDINDVRVLNLSKPKPKPKPKPSKAPAFRISFADGDGGTYRTARTTLRATARVLNEMKLGDVVNTERVE